MSERRLVLRYLFYLGFHANACMFMRAYGALAMRHRYGYELILARDGTTGMENCATRRGRLATRASSTPLEQFAFCSVSSAELRRPPAGA